MSDEGREIKLENGRKLEFFKDSGVTITFNLATDVTDEQNKSVKLMGSYETKDKDGKLGKKVFVLDGQDIEQDIMNAIVDVDDAIDINL